MEKYNVIYRKIHFVFKITLFQINSDGGYCAIGYYSSIVIDLPPIGRSGTYSCSNVPCIVANLTPFTTYEVKLYTTDSNPVGSINVTTLEAGKKDLQS